MRVYIQFIETGDMKMITATYTAKNYRTEDVRKRYVRIDQDGVFCFCEVGEDRRYDLRQGFVTESELPKAIVLEAKKIQGYFPSYVEWPI